jgi:prepilin signal peptidase PulO-like enzyme (type II secretory pathway)
VTAPEAILRRVEKTALLLTIAGAAVAFAVFGSRAAVSLTIGAAIVIFNFFVLEKVMGGFLTPRTGMRLADVVVPAAGFLGILLLLTAVLRWKRFDLFAGLAGLSVIVLAIVWEGLRGFRE